MPVARPERAPRPGLCAATRLGVLVVGLSLSTLVPRTATAGLLVEPAAAPGEAVVALRAADWRATRERLVERHHRLERMRLANEAERRLLDRRWRALTAGLGELEAAADDLAGRLETQRREALVLERRLAGLLAEIVQLSRDDAGDRRRLGQLQAVAAGMAAPFAEAKAALLASEAEAAALATAAAQRRQAADAAAAARAALEVRSRELVAAAGAVRLEATEAALRAAWSAEHLALVERRRAAATAARSLGRMRPTALPATQRAAAGLAAGETRRLTAVGLTTRAVIARPRVPAALPFGLGGGVAGIAGGELIPVAGVVVGRFGEERRPLFDRGITIEVDDRRLVRAPRRGEVVFAGPYAGFGLLLIIDHGDGYHSLLSGLSRFVVDRGWMLQAGQMVGVLEPEADGKGRLYVELRRSGVPVDPLSWFAAGQHKVRS